MQSNDEDQKWVMDNSNSNCNASPPPETENNETFGNAVHSTSTAEEDSVMRDIVSESSSQQPAAAAAVSSETRDNESVGAGPAAQSSNEINNDTQHNATNTNPSSSAAVEADELLPLLSPSWLTVGRIVFVQSRTWPGINCPGGPGHIENVYEQIVEIETTNADTSTGSIGNSIGEKGDGDQGNTNTNTKSTTRGRHVTHVDIKYLGGALKPNDKCVPIEYVSDHNEFALAIQTGTRSRRTKRNTRRCTNCGAFASDCGDCDWVLAQRVREEELRIQVEKEMREREHQLLLQREQEEMGELLLEDTDSSDSEMESGIEQDVDSEEEERRKVKFLSRNRKRNKQFIRQRRKKKTQVDVQQEDESDSEDDEEIPLAVLQRQAEKARRARERKLAALKKVVDGEDASNSKKQKHNVDSLQNIKGDADVPQEKPKKKKKRSRTRPEHSCALGDLPSGKGKGASSTSDNEARKTTKKKKQDDSTRATNKEQSEGQQKQNVDDSIFDLDSDSDSGNKSSVGHEQENEVTFEAAIDGMSAEDGNDEELLTPKEMSFSDEEGDDSESSDDDDDVPLKDLAKRTDFSNRLRSKDNEGVGNKSNLEKDLTADGGQASDDEEMLTPTDTFFDNHSDDDVAGGDFIDVDANGSYTEGHNSKGMSWGDLPNFIRDLCTKIEDELIPNIQNELSAMKRKLMLAKKQASRPLEISRDRRTELNSLAAKSFELNKYVIQELHRNGVDQCNFALTRLLSKRERRENKDTLTASQKKASRKPAVELLDINVANLYDLVRDIDSEVTAFQKDVDSLKTELYGVTRNSGTGMSHGIGGDFSTEIYNARVAKRRRKQRMSTDKEYENHQHASRKRKSSGHSQSKTSQKRRNNGDRSDKTSRSKRRPDSNGDEVNHPQVAEHDAQEAGDQLSSGNSDDEVADASMNFESAHVDFVGETDDFDDNQASALPEGSGVGRALRRTTGQRSTATSKDSQSSSRQSNSIADSMQSFLDKQAQDVVWNGSEASSISHSRGTGSGSRSSQGQSQSRQASTSSANNSVRASNKQTGQSRVSQNGNISRAPRAQPTNAAKSNSIRGHGGRQRSGNAQSTSSHRQGGGRPRSKSNAAQTEDVLSSRPGIPNELSTDMLFNSISRRQVDLDAANVGHQLPPGDKSINDQCQVLMNCYPNQLQSCDTALASLTSIVVFKSAMEFHKDEIVTLLKTLHCIFERKCTTLLDIIQTHPEHALFQIDCWCLVFRVFEKKLNRKLSKEEGVLHTIFGEHTTMANHILLQVVDALYSQLLWEEYGKTPPFDRRVYGRLRSLCFRIGSVVPLLDTACHVALKKLECANWHLSLTNGQKGNQLDKVVFVSAIAPEHHKQYILSGEAMPKVLKSRINSFKMMIPRQDIDAAWSIMGFFSSCTPISASLLPSAKHPYFMLKGIVLYSQCGTLPKSDSQSQPSKQHLETCSNEVERIHSLLSSKLLGETPSIDDFIKDILKRSITLEAHDEVLNQPSTISPSKTSKCVKQLWNYSCIAGTLVGSETELQAGVMNLEAPFLDNAGNDACSLMPSTVLLQRCISITTTYSKFLLANKKVRWNGWSKKIEALCDEFLSEASKLDRRNSGKNKPGDAFTAMFESIERATEAPTVESPASAHFREAACYLMLAGVVARSQCNNVPSENTNFLLNGDFREKMWKHSSDEQMQRYLQHCLDGDRTLWDGESSGNLCHLHISAKVMTFTTLLHMHVVDAKADATIIISKLCNHLLAVKADIDENAMVYVSTTIISNLLASCNVLGRLNQKRNVQEHGDAVHAHLNSAKQAVNVTGKISMWLNLIFGRAKFIIDLVAKVNATDNVMLGQLVEAIKRLGGSSSFLFVMQSLTNVLNCLVETAERNSFSKALSDDGCLERAFRSCLGAMRNAIALVHSCQAEDVAEMQGSNEWESAAKYYVSFVERRTISSILDLKCISGQHGKLCRNQSGGIVCVLAALCSIKQARPILLKPFGIFDTSKRKDVGDENTFLLQQMGVCFSCELTRLARDSPTCKAIATFNIDRVINFLVTSLVDADTLAMFPTCNLAMLSKIDSPNGHTSRSKGNDILTKSQIHSLTNSDDPDIEAHKIKRRSGDYFDTAGPTYTSKHLWSFCEHTAHLLTMFDVSESIEKNASDRMQEAMWAIGKDLVLACKNLRSDNGSLELLPLVSAERECLKRFIFFQELFNALKRQSNPAFHKLTKQGGLNGIISTSIIENLHYLSSIELDVEEQKKLGCNDSDSRYQRAHALTFQKAYTELCGSLITLMLRENKNWVSQISLRDLMRQRLTFPALQKTLDIRSVLEVERTTAKTFKFCLRKKSSTKKGKAEYMDKNLSSTLSHRASQLLSFAAGITDKKYGSDLLKAILSGTTAPSSAEPSPEYTTSIANLFSIISYRLILTPETFGVCSPLTSDGLQRAVDNCLLCSEVLRTDGLREQKSILEFREIVLGSSIVNMLKNDSITPELGVSILHMLTCIAKTYSSTDFTTGQKIHQLISPLGRKSLTSVATYTKLFHSIKECLCISIKSGTIHAALMRELSSSTAHLGNTATSLSTTLNQSDENASSTLISLARESAQHAATSPFENHLTYIYQTSIWINKCLKLLHNQPMAAHLRDAFNKWIKSKETGSESLNLADSKIPEIQQLGQHFHSLTNLEKALSI